MLDFRQDEHLAGQGIPIFFGARQRLGRSRCLFSSPQLQSLYKINRREPEQLYSFCHGHFFQRRPYRDSQPDPPHKRVIIDHREENLSGSYTCIYQDHKSDIYDSLTTLLPQLDKYKRLVLVAPHEAFHAKDLVAGFESFATKYNKSHIVVHAVEESFVKRGDAYITFSRYDQDDVDIIKITRRKKWKLGKDIGLISYNDTAVKEVLEDGITVISTDFHKMGEEAAKAILNKNTLTIRDHAKVILRNSL